MGKIGIRKTRTDKNSNLPSASGADKIRDRAQNAANMARTKVSDTLMESAKKALSNKVSFAFVLPTAAEF